MNYQTMTVMRLAVGGYVMYLGYQIISGQLAGEATTMSDAFAYISGAILALGGLATCVYAVFTYRKDLQNAKEKAEEANKEEP